MSKKRKINGALLSFVSCIFLLFPVSCTTVEERSEVLERDKGQFSLFLNVNERTSLDITFDLHAVNIISENGISREVLSSPVSINSLASRGNQLVLAETSVPEGNYRKLQFIVQQAHIKRKGVNVSLSSPSEGFETAINISIKKHQNTSLFVNWDPDASFVDGYLFQPAVSVNVEKPELSSLLLYVTNEDSDNVSVIDRQSGKVVATVMVGKSPRGIAVAHEREHSRIYVANSGSNTISVIDPTANIVEHEIPLRYGRTPGALKVGRLSYDKQIIFVAHYDTDSVSVIDTADFQELEKVNVGQGPVALAVDPEIETVSGSRFLDFEDISVLRNYREKFLNVYVVNENSNNVSVIVFDILKNRSNRVINLDVEWSPAALDVDYQRGKVYVANYNSNNLSVIDILKLVKGDTANAVSAINNVGNFITDVIADPVFDRIYLLKKRPGEIVIIRPFSEGFDALKQVTPPVMGTITVDNSSGSFLLGPEARKLYVINRGSNSVSVIDKTTKKEEYVIPVGRNPYGASIFQENN